MTVLMPWSLRKARKASVSLIGDKFGDAWDQAHAGFCHNAVGRVARRQYEDPWTALVIHDRMYLAVATALGETYRLRLRPPFPPVAQRWIFTWLLSSATCSGVSTAPATAGASAINSAAYLR